jgi:hypothetical protein
MLLLASGFLTMHGFLAVSASADVHVSHPQQAVGDSSTHALAGPVGTSAATASAAEVGVGAAHHQPSPADHHDVIAGCVVALVGIGLAGLALLTLRRPTVVQDLRSLVTDKVQLIGVPTARWSPPRVALCVIRV